MIELVDKANPDKVIAWACGKCGIVCHDEQLALQHCGPVICECGNECDKPYYVCKDCRNKKQAEKERAAREAAKVVSAIDYHGPVHWDQKDEYYEDACMAFEAIADDFDVADDEVDRNAQTLWACHLQKLSFCAEDVISGALESGEHHEEAYEMISAKATKILQKFLDGWIKEHASCAESWFPNTKKRIEIPQK